MMKNTTVLPPVAPSSALLMATSSFALVRTYANRLAAAVMNMIVAVVEAESIRIAQNSFSLILRYTNTPTNNPYTADTAAASVGVKIPP